MSLPSRILFAGSMLACAVLCGWAAYSFGGPAVTPMVCIAAICVVVAIVVWMIKAPGELENARVEGAHEPTYRLKRFEPHLKEEIWQLVLGKTQCTLLGPDGKPVTTFARQWAESAIMLPGFVSGEMIRVVREDWKPPEGSRWMVPSELLHSFIQAGQSIRPNSNSDTRFYWFSPSKDVVEAIKEYKQQSLTELGPEAAVPIRIKARQCFLSGFIGLAVGLAIVAFRFTSVTEQAAPPARSGTRLLAFAGIIAIIGLWRIGQGIILNAKAGHAA